MRKTALQQGLWSSILQVSRAGISGIVFLVIARWLSLEEVGIYGNALAVLTLAQLLVRTGISEATIQSGSDDRRYLATAFLMSLGVGAFCTVIMAVGIMSLGGEAHGQREILLALSVVPVLDAIGVVPEALMRRRLNFRALAFRSLFVGSFSGAVAITAAAMGAGALSLASFTILTSLLSSILAFLISKWSPTALPTKSDAISIALPAFRIFNSNLATATIAPVSQIILGFIAGPAAAGVYAIAQRCLGMISSLALDPARQIALPILSKARLDTGARVHPIIPAASLLSLIVTPLFLGLFATADVAMPLILGSHGKEVIYPVMGLSLSFFPMILSMLVGQALISEGKSSSVLRYSALQALLNIPVSATASPFGASFNAFAYTIRGYVLLPFVLRQAKYGISVSPTEIFMAAARPVVPGFIMMLFVMAAGYGCVLFGITVGWIVLLAKVFTGVAVYSIFVILLLPREYTVLKQDIRDFFRKPTAGGDLR